MTTGVDRLRPMLAEFLPAYRSAEISCLGTGLDHVAYLVGNELIVRLTRSEDDKLDEPEQAAAGEHAGETGREGRLLRVVGRYATVPVPEPLVVTDSVLAYRALPGVPLLRRSWPWRLRHSADLGDVLGRFLASLRAIPEDSLAGTVGVDAEPLSASLAEARECWATIADWAENGIPASGRQVIEAFLDSPPPPPGHETCFSHNDLGGEHVLVDPATGVVTGVIDWTDAAFADPAVDLGLILRDLGVEAFRVANGWLTGAGGQQTGLDEDGRRDRAVFFGRCRLVEDLRFGIESDRPEYLTNSITAAEWLFAD